MKKIKISKKSPWYKILCGKGIFSDWSEKEVEEFKARCKEFRNRFEWRKDCCLNPSKINKKSSPQ